MPSTSASGEQKPRIEPLAEDEWDDVLRALVSRFPSGADRPLNIFTTLGRHPTLFRKWLGFGGALLDGRIGSRQRELLILRTAHNCSSEYEWAQHVPLARAAGVEEAEIAALRSPLGPETFESSELAMLSAADEIHAEGTIADPTWEALAVELDDASLIELVMLVGQYHHVATIVRTLRIQLET
ncbi:MAG TPA: carboxymuconolactone decarboxylase family protein [Acidimicrobiales bacterium]|nr:carboxymuconolactone decarboxylase family protein [Acidimicrobiales bacterium]